MFYTSLFSRGVIDNGVPGTNWSSSLVICIFSLWLIGHVVIFCTAWSICSSVFANGTIRFAWIPNSFAWIFLSSWHGVYFGNHIWCFEFSWIWCVLQREWFSGSRVSSQASYSIACKELLPVVLAAHDWGPHSARRNILSPSNNDRSLFPQL